LFCFEFPLQLAAIIIQHFNNANGPPVTVFVPAASGTVTVVISAKSSIDVVVNVFSVALFRASSGHGLYILASKLSDDGFRPGEYITVIVSVVVSNFLVVLQFLALHLVTEVSEVIGTGGGSLMT
jgi:hypothetical protein